MKRLWMLVVSLRGVNQGIWSHLGCHDKTPLILAVKVTFKVHSKGYVAIKKKTHIPDF